MPRHGPRTRRFSRSAPEKESDQVGGVTRLLGWTGRILADIISLQAALKVTYPPPAGIDAFQIGVSRFRSSERERDRDRGEQRWREGAFIDRVVDYGTVAGAYEL